MKCALLTNQESTKAVKMNAAGSKSPNKPQIITVFNGTLLDVYGFGFDPNYLLKLPESIREEVIVSTCLERGISVESLQVEPRAFAGYKRLSPEAEGQTSPVKKPKLQTNLRVAAMFDDENANITDTSLSTKFLLALAENSRYGAVMRTVTDLDEKSRPLPQISQPISSTEIDTEDQAMEPTPALPSSPSSLPGLPENFHKSIRSMCSAVNRTLCSTWKIRGYFDKDDQDEAMGNVLDNIIATGNFPFELINQSSASKHVSMDDQSMASIVPHQQIVQHPFGTPTIPRPPGLYSGGEDLTGYLEKERGLGFDHKDGRHVRFASPPASPQQGPICSQPGFAALSCNEDPFAPGSPDGWEYEDESPSVLRLRLLENGHTPWLATELAIVVWLNRRREEGAPELPKAAIDLVFKPDLGWQDTELEWQVGGWKGKGKAMG